MDNAFDRQIKSALEQFELPYDASTWSVLEQRLAQLPGQTDNVDQALKGILQNAELPYQSAHWDLLVQKMTAESKRRRRVLFMKILEAAAIFLLLFWAMPGSWTGMDGSLDESSQTAIAGGSTQKSSTNHPNKKYKRSVTPSALSPTSAMEQAEPLLSGIALPEEQPTVPDNSKQGWGTTFQTTDNQFPIDGTLAPSSPDLIDITSQAISFQDISFLGQKSFVALSTVQPQKQSFVSIPQKAKRQSRMYIAASVSLDQNRVKTTAPGLQRTQGYGSGISVGYQKGKWAVETGLIYKRKTYTPRKEVEIISGDINKGYNGQFVQQVDADIISVPVQAVRQVAHLGRTRAKVAAGLVANVVVNKAYDAKNVFYPGFQTSGPTDPPQFSAAYNGRGVLENGGLDGNSYLSLTAGVRLEHSLNAQTSLFAEANYQQALGGGKGIGPKPARIHTASLNAGVIQRI